MSAFRIPALASLGVSTSHQASIGAPFIVQPEEVRLRAEGLDRGIQSLARDIKANLVYNSPAVMRSTATAIQNVPGQAGVAADLRAEATKIDARIRRIGAAKAASQQAYSKSFGDFSNAWNAFYATNVADPDLFTNGANYDKLNNFDVDYRTVQVPAYKKFGYPLTYLAPAPNAGKEPSFPWTTLLWVAGIGAAAFLLHETKGLLPAQGPATPAPARLALPARATTPRASAPKIIDAEFVED